MKKLLTVMTLGIFGLALAAQAAAPNAVAPKDIIPKDIIQDAGGLKRGEYVARASNCIACHTYEKGPYAGGTPFGVANSPNITPDVETGIGAFDFTTFDMAVRQGVSPRGYMSAMMPPSYSIMTDRDVRDLYDYFMHGVKPVNNLVSQPGPPQGAGPRPVRPFTPAPGENPAVARGQYLIEGLGHCGFCHTPRNAAGVEKAQWASQGPDFLSGGDDYAGWIAINLRGDNPYGLARRSVEDLTRFFLTGRNDPTSAFGKMLEVVETSTHYLTREDAVAMARYLKSLPPKNPSAKPYAENKAEARALWKGDDGKTGAATYVDSCAACHRTDGSGYVNFFPELRGNPVLFSENPVSLIHIVLQGQTMPGFAAAPSYMTMPPFGWRLNDQQIADVVSFIRGSWGNEAPAVKAEDVRKVRENKTLFPDPRIFGSGNVDKLLDRQD